MPIGARNTALNTILANNKITTYILEIGEWDFYEFQGNGIPI